jgi:hypothetical protein
MVYKVNRCASINGGVHFIVSRNDWAEHFGNLGANLFPTVDALACGTMSHNRYAARPAAVLVLTGDRIALTEVRIPTAELLPGSESVSSSRLNHGKRNIEALGSSGGVCWLPILEAAPEADCTTVASYGGARYQVVKRTLLVFVLSISCVSFVGAAAQSTTNAPPKPDAHSAFVPHLDIPQNCQKTLEADGSVLMTCDCENCGQPEARDGLYPLPWGCVTRKEGVACSYGEGDVIDTSSSRIKSRI